MKRPRVTIIGLMVAVGVIGVNLGVGRVLFDFDSPFVLVAVGVPGISLQVAVFGLICHQGRGRAFWAGFLGLGCPLLFGIVSAVHHHAARGPHHASDGCEWFLCNAVTRYSKGAFNLLEHYLPQTSLAAVRGSDAYEWFCSAVILAAPHLLISLCGGLLALSLATVGMHPLACRARCAK